MARRHETNVVTKHAVVGQRLGIMMLAGLVIVGLAGVLLVAAGALLLLSPAASGQISPGGVLAVVASLLVMLGVGTILAAVAGLVFLRRFRVRGLLAAVAVCGVLLTAWVAVLRPWLGASWRVAERALQLVFEPPVQPGRFVQPASGVIVGEVTIAVPIWLLVGLVAIPLAVLLAIFNWPERKSR